MKVLSHSLQTEDSCYGQDFYVAGTSFGFEISEHKYYMFSIKRANPSLNFQVLTFLRCRNWNNEHNTILTKKERESELLYILIQTQQIVFVLSFYLLPLYLVKKPSRELSQFCRPFGHE